MCGVAGAGPGPVVPVVAGAVPGGRELVQTRDAGAGSGPLVPVVAGGLPGGRGSVQIRYKTRRRFVCLLTYVW